MLAFSFFDSLIRGKGLHEEQKKKKKKIKTLEDLKRVKISVFFSFIIISMIIIIATITASTKAKTHLFYTYNIPQRSKCFTGNIYHSQPLMK